MRMKIFQLICRIQFEAIKFRMEQMGMKQKDLAEAIGITVQNLSILKTGKARAIRFSTLDALCKHLDCQPGDILEYQPDKPEPSE